MYRTLIMLNIFFSLNIAQVLSDNSEVDTLSYRRTLIKSNLPKIDGLNLSKLNPSDYSHSKLYIDEYEDSMFVILENSNEIAYLIFRGVSTNYTHAKPKLFEENSNFRVYKYNFKENQQLEMIELKLTGRDDYLFYNYEVSQQFRVNYNFLIEFMIPNSNHISTEEIFHNHVGLVLGAGIELYFINDLSLEFRPNIQLLETYAAIGFGLYLKYLVIDPIFFGVGINSYWNSEHAHIGGFIDPGLNRGIEILAGIYANKHIFIHACYYNSFINPEGRHGEEFFYSGSVSYLKVGLGINF